MVGNKYRLIPVDYNPFERNEIEKIAPATEPQKEIYISTLIGLDDANRAYNECFTLLLQGNLNLSAFRSAFNQLLLRHDILRTTISGNGGSIIVFKKPIFQLQEADISSYTDDDKKAFLTNLVYQEAETPLDIVKGPAFRTYLTKTDAEEWQFTLTGHHVMFDGWSLGILLQDLGNLYSAYTQDQLPQLSAPFQFADYAREQEAYERTEEYGSVTQFWAKQLKNNLPDFDFPTDFERPVSRTYKSQRNDFAIDFTLSSKIKQTGAKNGASFITTLIAAFEIFLHKVSGQSDVIFGLPTAGQSVTGHTHLIGHCVNMLPIRSKLNNNLSFTAYLKQRKSSILDSYDHQRITFGSLLKLLNVPRNAAKVALMPITFNVDLGMTNDVHFEGMDYQLISNPRHYETFDFFLNATGTESSMVFEWSFNTKLFKSSTILKHHRYLEKILQAIANNPEIIIRDIPGQYNEEDRLAYEQLNDTQKDFNTNKTIDQLITDIAATYPQAIAINFKKTLISYEQMEKKANQFAHYLIEKGIHQSDTVGIALERSAYLPIAILGVLKTGASFQPLDPSYPAQRIDFILQDGGASLLITSEKHQELFGANTLTDLLEEIVLVLDNYPSFAPVVERRKTDLVYILHTSGSTGKPKGVLIQHEQLVKSLLSMQIAPGLQQTDKFLSFSSISFDIFYLEMFLPLITGATMVMTDSASSKDAREIIDIIHRENISVVQTTPSVWNSILLLSGDIALPVKAFCGGESLSKDLAHEMLAKVNELWNVYGPTETTIWASAKKISLKDEVITIGKPIHNTRFYLLDNQLQLVPQGKTGEIFIAGDHVGMGYKNRPELTAERFLPDTISNIPGQRMYQTGDIGCLLDNGEIQCLGRADQQIKLNGHRIEPEEIEHCIKLVNTTVDQVVVKPVTNHNGISFLVAYYTVTNNNNIPETIEWKRLLKAHLPQYMVPEYYVLLDAFPLTPNGKIDRKSLIAPEQLSNKKSNNQPNNPTEQIVMDIWAAALQNNSLALDDDFFEMGGHSLIAAQVMQQIEQATGKKLPLATLFNGSTVRKLATAIDEWQANVSTAFKTLVPINTKGNKTPLFMIHGAGLNILMFYPLAKYLSPDQPLYGLQALGLDGSDIQPQSMEEIAAVYNKEILQAVAGNEFAIIGYSLGGIIGFEMARQLTAMGKKVKLLGAIDTFIDSEDHHLPTLARYTNKLIRQPKKFSFFLRSVMKTPVEALKYQAYVTRNKVKGVIEKISPDDKEFTLEEQINIHYEKAYLEYKLQPYKDTFHLFKVEERIYYVDDPEFLGWKPYTPGGLEIVNVAGDHKTFLLPPNDKNFAERLQKMLDQLSPKVNEGTRTKKAPEMVAAN